VNFWEFLWLIFITYVLIAYIMLMISIWVDIFRDRDLGGFAKFLWIIFLVFFPFLGVLVYLIARGRAMTERQLAQAQSAKAQQDSYIRSVAGTQASAADQIASAKALLDSGAISQAEFDALKAKALA
jgi:ABC-type multidrug transport system fused ATPase/permease subunit